MVSQFISPDDVKLLGDLDFYFPEGTHAIGRLDNHSEGLLLLTTNRNITRLLFQGKIPHKRTYIVQVLHEVSLASLQQIREGVSIKIKGNIDWVTSPCEAEIIESAEREFPTAREFSNHKPSTWLKITLTEGKYHQVRKMVYALRHKCRRLIRVSIEDIHLDKLQPGEIREMNEDDFFRLLKLE